MDVLVNGLSVCGLEGEARLALAERAVHALDDMLWSRYQLFLQVLNHKTNVALNAMLRDAIPAALDETQVPFKRPSRFEDFVEFTDDHVMSSVFSVCSRHGHQETPYGRALVHRNLPLHIGFRDVSSTPTATEKAEFRESFARHLGWDPKDASKIIVWEAESHLVKPGPLPLVLVRDKGRNTEDLKSFDDRSIVLKNITSGTLQGLHRRLHFFVDRSTH